MRTLSPNYRHRDVIAHNLLWMPPYMIDGRTALNSASELPRYFKVKRGLKRAFVSNHGHLLRLANVRPMPECRYQYMLWGAGSGRY